MDIIFIDLKIESNKNILIYSVNQARQTWGIMLPNFTRRTTRGKYFQYTCI